VLVRVYRVFYMFHIVNSSYHPIAGWYIGDTAYEFDRLNRANRVKYAPLPSNKNTKNLYLISLTLAIMYFLCLYSNSKFIF
jgi:hypothetical protein